MNSQHSEKKGLVAVMFIIVFAMLEKAECERCEHILKSSESYFGVWDFRGQHQNATSCIWKIETAAGSRIKLILRLFDDHNCTQNYFAVYDGHSTKDKSLGNFCGKFTAPVIITTTNRMLVVLHSDTFLRNRGFQAFYSTECNHVINTTEGYITSPNYPNPYPNSQLCIYEFHTTPGKRIKLYFDDFNLEFGDFCWFDFVAIYDGATTNDTLLGKHCGDSKLSAFVSTSHRMLMVFHADASQTRTGFRAHYSSEPASNNSHMEISSSLSDVDGNNEVYTKQPSPGI